MKSCRASLISVVPVKGAKLWSSEELRELRILAMQGVAPGIIAARLRRTESSVRNKAGMQGISLRQAKIVHAEKRVVHHVDRDHGRTALDFSAAALRHESVRR